MNHQKELTVGDDVNILHSKPPESGRVIKIFLESSGRIGYLVRLHNPTFSQIYYQEQLERINGTQ